jgi:hypothetical protein
MSQKTSIRKNDAKVKCPNCPRQLPEPLDYIKIKRSIPDINEIPQLESWYGKRYEEKDFWYKRMVRFICGPYGAAFQQKTEDLGQLSVCG